MEKNKKQFLYAMVLLSGVLFIRYWDGIINEMNSTMFAFTYRYSFISRGLIGTIYGLIDGILPVDMMNHGSLIRFNLAAVALYILLLLGFLSFCLKRCKENMVSAMEYVMVLLLIFAVPMFAGQYNFGRSDMYCVMVTLLGAMVLVERKAQWLVIPLSALGVMVHQGYVFMFANVILVLLVYRTLSTRGREKKGYGVLFVLTFLTVSALFLYFELFSHAGGDSIYQEIVDAAKALGDQGSYHQDVIDKEILGIDLSDREIRWKKQNLIQAPLYVLLNLPYIIWTFRLWRQMIRNGVAKQEKWKYFIIAVGAATMLPDLLLKVDYGRWVFAITFYYLVMTILLLAMGDRNMEKCFATLLTEIRQKYPFSIIFLMYPLLFQPLGDVYICDGTEKVLNFVNAYLLHWW
jgi:hypothetical protein